MNISVNFLAVIVAAIASMALGFFWYSPSVFGKKWMKLMGLSSKELKAEQKKIATPRQGSAAVFSKMGPLYALSLLGALVMAYVLTHVVRMSEVVFDYTPLSTGLSSGFWMWLGFVAPVQMTETIFGSKKWELYFINTGYQLVSLLIMGMIVASWV